MNIVKGYRFHPTDEELIEYLHIKTFDRDSLVQVIDELQDICESEPWELPGKNVFFFFFFYIIHRILSLSYIPILFLCFRAFGFADWGSVVVFHVPAEIQVPQ